MSCSLKSMNSRLFSSSFLKKFPFHFEKTRDKVGALFEWLHSSSNGWQSTRHFLSLLFKISPNISSAMPNFFFSLSLQFSLLCRVCISCNSFVSWNIFTPSPRWYDDVVVMTSKSWPSFVLVFFFFFYVPKIRKTFPSHLLGEWNCCVIRWWW